MKRYKYTKLRNLGPVHGFLIHTPDDRELRDTHPQTIVRELNAANDRIRLLIAERDTARLQSDQKVSLREEFCELLGTDDIEQGITVVCDLKQLAAVRLGYIKQLETENDALRADLLLWHEQEVKQ
jgi:hypothetical protein